jgi:alanine-synthesizing transaminase
MFSSRLPWNLPPNPISALLQQKRQQNIPLLDLTESNPTRSGISYPVPKLLEGFRDPGMFVYEPDAAGLATAREQVAAMSGVETSRVLLTTSTSEAYSWLFKLLCNPGDEVLVPRPSYPLFEFLANLEMVKIIGYPLMYHGSWSIDFAALEEAISTRTRAIVVVNPNNPTGSYLKQEETERLAKLCCEHDLALISDEVFADYSITADEQRTSTLTGIQEATTFCLNGLSKLIGMPQMKLGWIITNNAAAHEKLELIADTYLSVGTPVQYALPYLLAARESVQTQIRARLRTNLALLQSKLQPRKVEGGWYAVVQVPRVLTEEQWVLQLLEEFHVLVQPGYFYDFPSEAFLVLSLLTPPDLFQQGVSRLCELHARHS